MNIPYFTSLFIILRSTYHYLISFILLIYWLTHIQEYVSSVKGRIGGFGGDFLFVFLHLHWLEQGPVYARYLISLE